MNQPHSSHQKIHTKIAREILKSVSADLNLSYQVVFRQFTENTDSRITRLFWKKLHTLYPEFNHLQDIYYCSGCRSFDLNSLK